ncbi:MAG TPA: TetR family transcriptional regulator [Pseudonocardia sp.]|jgi:AcrR family transcriptional regulator|uniref:TetR family transcriptional regulator n=1 Tax=Pseudonocardia sp. TaxID=60912 RepID=UPI002B4B1CE6|nr:TetR family transcriptional regulator [Pseudonocardia sp.]HLU59251.1 TetR family transcriptional regulator [Pseudonocardia sp.]
MSGGLRERTRSAVRAQLAELALELFAEHGFDETTVEQVARAAGVSTRSLFRYFPTKEDMVLDSVDAMGDAVAEELRARPADEDPWTSLHAVLHTWATRIAAAGERLTRLQLIERTPALRARSAQRREEARLRVAEVLRERTGLDAFTADLLTAAAGAALEAAEREWLRSGGTTDHAALVDRAFAALRPTSAAAG